MVNQQSEEYGEGPGSAWTRLAGDYEQARNREDSLDRVVERPS